MFNVYFLLIFNHFFLNMLFSKIKVLWKTFHEGQGLLRNQLIQYIGYYLKGDSLAAEIFLLNLFSFV